MIMKYIIIHAIDEKSQSKLQSIMRETFFFSFFLGEHHGVNRRRVRGSSKSLGFMNVHQLVVKIFQSGPKLSGDPWCRQGIKTQAVNLIIIIAVLLYCLNAIVVQYIRANVYNVWHYFGYVNISCVVSRKNIYCGIQQEPIGHMQHHTNDSIVLLNMVLLQIITSCQTTYDSQESLSVECLHVQLSTDSHLSV